MMDFGFPSARVIDDAEVTGRAFIRLIERLDDKMPHAGVMRRFSAETRLLRYGLL